MLPAKPVHLTWHSRPDSEFDKPFSASALDDFARGLNVKLTKASVSAPAGVKMDAWLDTDLRQERTVTAMAQHVQWVLSQCEKTRDQTFWKTITGDTSSQKQVKQTHRDRFWDVIGRLPNPSMPINPRARLLKETEK